MSELLVPQVPEARPNDPEDVSWALSTAEAMWARGDHSEGIKWVRRAAEAASEAEDDARALELAKAAADLAGMIARRSSRESIELEEVAVARPPPPPARMSAPPPKPAATSSSPVSLSRAPAPMPARPAAAPLSSRAAPPPPRASAAPPAPKKVPAAAESRPASMKPGAPTPVKAAPGKKSPRRSRENLDAEARAALQVNSTAKLAALDSSTALIDTAETVAIQVPHRRRSRPETSSEKGPPTTGAMRAAKPAADTASPHDPGMMTSQAVRVVVWRDANGVHVAPAGTVVSAIKIDAVLVALEPGADLTAWLGASDPRR